MDFLLSLFISNFYFKKSIDKISKNVTNISDEINFIKNEIKKPLPVIRNLKVGDLAVARGYHLKATSKTPNIEFSVDLEVEITDISLSSAKIKVIDFSSPDKYGRDPNNRSAIIDYMNSQWISLISLEKRLSSIEEIRDSKLTELGID